MKLFSRWYQGAVFAAGLLLASSAHAGFIGKEVTFDILYGGVNGKTATIADGTTLGPVFDGQFSATFSDNSILFNGLCCGDFAEFVFYRISGRDLGFTKVSLNSAGSNHPGMTQDRIMRIEADRFYINMSHLILEPQYYFTLDVEFAEKQAVPEPGSITLLGVAAAALAVVRRRRVTRR